MDIQTRKIEFVQAFLALQSEETVSQFERLLNKLKVPAAEQDLKPFTLEELQERIAKSEQDFQNGRYKTTSQILSKY